MSVVHTLRLRSSNAYLLVGSRPILVDTGSRGDTEPGDNGRLPGGGWRGRLFVGHGGPLHHHDVQRWRAGYTHR